MFSATSLLASTLTGLDFKPRRNVPRYVDVLPVIPEDGTVRVFPTSRGSLAISRLEGEGAPHSFMIRLSITNPVVTLGAMDNFCWTPPEGNGRALSVFGTMTDEEIQHAIKRAGMLPPK